jgi:DNA-directed RNA polymerase subunit RPC12/RpoP
MTTFRCGGCGARIAVHDRHLGRLMVCPDCGDSTHPVAIQLQEKRIVPAAAEAQALAGGAGALAAMAPFRLTAAGATGVRFPPVQKCANCGQAIGRLQQILRWEHHVVCMWCHRALSAESAELDAAAEAEAAQAARVTEILPEPVDDPAPRRKLFAFRRRGARQAQLPAPADRQPAEMEAVGGPQPAPPPSPAAVLVRVPDAVPARNATDSSLGPAPVAEISFDLRGLVGLLIGVALVGAVVFFALSLISVIGGIVLGVLLALLGLYCLRRGSLAVRKRFEQLDSLRAQRGTAGVLSVFRAWAKTQPPRRLPWVLTVVVLGGTLYPLYLASSWLADRGRLVKRRG